MIVPISRIDNGMFFFFSIPTSNGHCFLLGGQARVQHLETFFGPRTPDTGCPLPVQPMSQLISGLDSARTALCH